MSRDATRSGGYAVHGLRAWRIGACLGRALDGARAPRVAEVQFSRATQNGYDVFVRPNKFCLAASSAHRRQSVCLRLDLQRGVLRQLCLQRRYFESDALLIAPFALDSAEEREWWAGMPALLRELGE